MGGGVGAGVDEVFTLDGEAGAAEGGAGEGEGALRGAFADTDGPAGLAGGRVEGEGAAAAALQTRGGDAPVGEDLGHPVEGVAFADGAEVEMETRGVGGEGVRGGIEGEERGFGGLVGESLGSVGGVEGTAGGERGVGGDEKTMQGVLADARRGARSETVGAGDVADSM